MSSKLSSEQAAATVEAAIRLALEDLGAQEDDVTIEVLSTPRAGVLRLGARQARVRVTRRPPEAAATSRAQAPPPAPPVERSQAARAPLQRREEPRPPVSEERPPERQSRPREERPPRDERPRRDERRPRDERPAPRPSRPPRSAEAGESQAAEGESAGPDTRRSEDRAEQAREATDILSKILELMGEKGEISEGEHDPESIELAIKGDGSGLLIGRHGQTLDALEYIVNRILARRVKEAVTIVLDTESYRARRRQQIHRMALSMGEQAKREHATVKLEPMAPRDRRIVHLALKDDPLITTRSEGEGYLRSIEISPVGGGAPREGRSRERGRERSHEREREPAIGEQGGFKHGQKRII
ncbi:MAG TPA: RNA-binding cell elongation regulator Jag/EloR [Candidatus Binataceae bacterium]|nr:RNA-binding cell elongation regulator Jag/EloR [Candidatus Binataceae bacterium]